MARRNRYAFRHISLTWDLEDAEAVYELLYNEGVRTNDKGWFSDAQKVRDQINQHNKEIAEED